MFDPIHSPTESNDTRLDAGGTGDADPGSAAPLPDAAALLAAAGLPAHAIREVSRLPGICRCGRLTRGKGRLGEG